MLAHIALAEHDTARAETIYDKISGSSTEAMIFLSQQAERRGNSHDAVLYATQAVNSDPDDMNVRANLYAIQHGNTL
jgi:hypothetical protein